MWANILNFDRATYISLMQNESYQQNPEKRNGEDEIQY